MKSFSMPQKEIIIVKIGGSIVTQKYGKRPSLRRAHIQKIASLMVKKYNPEKHALILIHGAGSFGHLHAHRHALAEGTKNHPEKLFRATENQALDEKLNSEIATLFIQAGLPVTGMPTRALALNKNGQISTFEMNGIETAVKVGAIPLLHGDMVFDATWGLSVLSGDILIAKLAEFFSVKKIFFASDVDGIFSKDPHLFKDAELIRKVSLKEIMNGSIQLGESHSIDVTGGLSKKFSSFQKMKSLESIFFFNGFTVNNFSFPFDQKNFLGTTIENNRT